MNEVIKFPEDEITDSAHGGAPDYALTGLSQLPDARLLTKQELARVLGCSCRTVERMTKRFDMPPGAKLGGREIWTAGKVKAWIAEAEAEAEKEARLRRAKPGRKQ